MIITKIKLTEQSFIKCQDIVWWSICLITWDLLLLIFIFFVLKVFFWYGCHFDVDNRLALTIRGKKWVSMVFVTYRPEIMTTLSWPYDENSRWSAVKRVLVKDSFCSILYLLCWIYFNPTYNGPFGAIPDIFLGGETMYPLLVMLLVLS